MTTTIQESITSFQIKTIQVLVDQRVRLSEDEQNNVILDWINDIKSDFASIIPDYHQLITNLVAEIVKTKEISERIFIYESVVPIYEISRKIIKLGSADKYKNGYQTELEEYKVLTEDLGEIISDLQKQIEGPDKEMISMFKKIKAA